MKKIILITFMFISNISISQNKTNIEVEYDMVLNFLGSSQYNSRLIFNNESSYFISIEDFIESEKKSSKMQETDTSYYFNVKIHSKAHNIVLTDKKKDSLYELKEGFSIKKYFIIGEKTPIIKWKLSNETKTIKDYECYKAFCEFRGRKYTAWYTLEIPTFFGPFKFHGLPGLILEIFDDTKEVFFIAKKITNSHTTIPKLINIRKEAKFSTKEKYNKDVKKFFSDLEKKMSSKIGRGYKMKISVPVIKSIEIE
ncbi:GLPGLI family protein [uncultured Tenacibaculum sp.]|uniref:GLPGLI family protein n=1 Tax=uncultured Tenacibaculum sp. TaxID=174713 RepID=UPI0026210F09|nr:GLPGLI family protein [uncultured Tenacibaculum sp.]